MGQSKMHKHSSSFRREASPAPPPTPRLRSAPNKPYPSNITASTSTPHVHLTDHSESVDRVPAEEAVGEEATSLLSVPSSSKYRRKRKGSDGKRRKEGAWGLAVTLGKIIVWVLGIGLFLWCGATIVGWIINLPDTTAGGYVEDSPQGAAKQAAGAEQKQDPVLEITPPKVLTPPEVDVEVANSGSFDAHSHGGDEHLAEAAVYNYDDYAYSPTPRVVMIPLENPTKWAVHLPRTGVQYPLPAETYQQLCSAANSASANISAALHGGSGHGSHRGYYTPDPTFLPPPVLPATTCPKTLTYLLSHLPTYKHPHSSLGATLMGVWLAYGLAQKENRTFYLDDTDWEWGSWTDYFLPLPTPQLSTTCTPPPYHARLPCPHNTDHLLLTPLTHSAETFGHNFVDQYEDGHAREVMRQVTIFSLAHEGYKALFRLTPTLETLASGRKTLLLDAAQQDFLPTGWKRGRDGVLGIHIRHGDAHPSEYWYHKGYLPSERYVDVVRDMMVVNETYEAELPVVMISDDGGVWKDGVLEGGWKVQDDFPLPSEGDLPLSDPESLDSLGKREAKNRALLELDHPVDVLEQSLPGFPFVKDFDPKTYPGFKRRELVNGYLLDIKITGELATEGRLGGGGDGEKEEEGVLGGVVCGGYSYTCRVLAVMMGWERAIVRQRWRNVDGWTWQRAPEGEEEVGLRKGFGGEWRGWVW